MILPQALRRLLPPLVSLLVNIIQNSTLAQVIGGLEMLEAAERQNERITAIPPIGLGEIHAFEIFGFVDDPLLPDLVPAHAAGGAAREAPRLAPRSSDAKGGCAVPVRGRGSCAVLAIQNKTFPCGRSE